MKSIVVNEEEFKRAFEETLLKIEKSLNAEIPPCDPFRTDNYYMHKKSRELIESFQKLDPSGAHDADSPANVVRSRSLLQLKCRTAQNRRLRPAWLRNYHNSFERCDISHHVKLIRTIKINLKAEAADLLPTIRAFTDAFNYISKIGYDKKKHNAIELHNLTYYSVRSIFSLPAQLSCAARNQAAEALKAIRKKKYAGCPKSKQQSIRYDANSYSLFLDKQIVSLLTIEGRKKYSFVISNYHKDYFKNWKYTSADLCIKKGKVCLHIVFETQIADIPTNGTFVGMDRGISNIAVLSNNTFYTGKNVKHITQKYNTNRRKLQKANTKSAKRHLRKLSGKEKRFRADVNHQISKKIIQSLNPGDTLVLEDLKGIRARRLRKGVRTLINRWSFYQLEQFLQYKANAEGICIVKVPARYTSQTCSHCSFCAKNNRKTQAKFECGACGFKLNADLNASRNIRNKAVESYKLSVEAVINQPIVPV